MPSGKNAWQLFDDLSNFLHALLAVSMANIFLVSVTIYSDTNFEINTLSVLRSSGGQKLGGTKMNLGVPHFPVVWHNTNVTGRGPGVGFCTS